MVDGKLKTYRLHIETGVQRTIYIVYLIFQVPPSDKNALAALWGKLASEILMQDWDTALDDLNRLKDVIDAGVSTIKKID